MHPDITLEDTQLPLERSPKIWGVILDPSISFHKHCKYVSDRIDKRNNMLKAPAGSSWGQDKEILLLTYNTLGKSIASYAAPVWSTNATDSSFKKIPTAQTAGFEDGDRGTQDGQYWPSPPGVPHAESQGPLRYAFCAVPCKLSGGAPRQSWHHNSRAKTHEGLSTPDITQLFFLDLAQAGSKETTEYWRSVHSQYRTRSRDSTENNDALSPNYGQATAIYCRTTSIGC